MRKKPDYQKIAELETGLFGSTHITPDKIKPRKLRLSKRKKEEIKERFQVIGTIFLMIAVVFVIVFACMGEFDSGRAVRPLPANVMVVQGDSETFVVAAGEANGIGTIICQGGWNYEPSRIDFGKKEVFTCPKGSKYAYTHKPSQVYYP